MSGKLAGLAFVPIAAHLPCMTSLARLLLLVAALAYGAMPMTGMSAMAMPVVHAMDATGDPREMVSASTAMADVDCPHSGQRMPAMDQGDEAGHSFKPVKMTSHCAACLTLPAETVLADSGKPARAAEASALPSRLVSQLMAPATPPPRA
ncbi:MAG: hypothetical protein U5N27_20230 [Rhizobium sp.]|nr:hypothetical protein [Rhizobium sp.]